MNAPYSRGVLCDVADLELTLAAQQIPTDKRLAFVQRYRLAIIDMRLSPDPVHEPAAALAKELGESDQLRGLRLAFAALAAEDGSL